jgi:hypothetical protein
MRKAQWIVLTLVILVAPALFAAEKFSQCLENCRPGNNPCTQCCLAQQDKAAQPCRDACSATERKCVEAAPAFCKNKYPNSQQDQRWCIGSEEAKCQRTGRDCRWNCGRQDWDVPGGCPGEVLPEKCPFDCQVWNSASKSCIGPRMNGCRH